MERNIPAVGRASFGMTAKTQNSGPLGSGSAVLIASWQFILPEWYCADGIFRKVTTKALEAQMKYLHFAQTDLRVGRISSPSAIRQPIMTCRATIGFASKVN